MLTQASSRSTATIAISVSSGRLRLSRRMEVPAPAGSTSSRAFSHCGLLLKMRDMSSTRGLSSTRISAVACSMVTPGFRRAITARNIRPL
jgi:hypothetical protein